MRSAILSDKEKTCIFILSGYFCAMLNILVVHANSSWHWISEIRPYDILPWAILGTILIEWIILWKYLKLNDKKFKVLILIVIANFSSFLFPYLFDWFWQYPMYSSLEQLFNHGPYYIIGLSYLILTCLVEFPIIYLALRKNVSNKKKLICTIILINVLTTILIAILERIITQGSW